MHSSGVEWLCLFFSFLQAAFEEEESQYFDSEDIFQQLNYECNDFGDDSGSDKDEDVVWIFDCYSTVFVFKQQL